MDRWVASLSLPIYPWVPGLLPVRYPRVAGSSVGSEPRSLRVYLCSAKSCEQLAENIAMIALTALALLGAASAFAPAGRTRSNG